MNMVDEAVIALRRCCGLGTEMVEWCGKDDRRRCHVFSHSTYIVVALSRKLVTTRPRKLKTLRYVLSTLKLWTSTSCFNHTKTNTSSLHTLALGRPFYHKISGQLSLGTRLVTVNNRIQSSHHSRFVRSSERNFPIKIEDQSNCSKNCSDHPCTKGTIPLNLLIKSITQKEKWFDRDSTQPFNQTLN